MLAQTLRNFGIAFIVFAVATPSRSERQQALPAPDSMRVTLRIGGDGGGGHILSSVNRIVTSPRGFVFLSQAQEMQISVFDTTGRAVARIGRRGRGPGEFAELFGLGLAGDTLWAIDYPSHHIHLFSLQGGLLASRDFSQSPRPLDQERHAAYAYISGGSAVMRFTSRDPRTPGIEAWMLLRVRSTTDSRFDTLLRADRGGRVWTVGRGGVSLAQPLDDTPLWVLSPTGSEIILVERLIGNTATGRVTVRRISTTSLQERRVSIDLRVERVPAATVDTIIERRANALMRVPSGSIPTIDAARSALRAGMFIPSHFPAVQRVVAGSDGSIWLQRFGRDEWIVLDDVGRIVRVVKLPAGSAANVHAATIDRAWLVVTTARGEPQVARYDLVRR